MELSVLVIYNKKRTAYRLKAQKLEELVEQIGYETFIFRPITVAAGFAVAQNSEFSFSKSHCFVLVVAVH